MYFVYDTTRPVMTRVPALISITLNEISRSNYFFILLRVHFISIFVGDRFNSAVGIEMIDDISKTEHKFDSIASVGKFGMYQESFLINRVSIF